MPTDTAPNASLPTATAQELIEAIRQGEIVILSDDEHRENEGDFVMAASHATPERVNFMITHGRGLLCAPLSYTTAEKLSLPLAPKRGQETHSTAFTLSVDAALGTTTGISAHERAHTLNTLADPQSGPQDLVSPGHVFPLMEHPLGLKARQGHTEASLFLVKQAGLFPAAVIIEILNEAGQAATRAQLSALARRFNLRFGTIESLLKLV